MKTRAVPGTDASGDAPGHASGRFGNVAGALLWASPAEAGAQAEVGEARALLDRLVDETVSRSSGAARDPRGEAVDPRDVAGMLGQVGVERVLLLVCERDWRPSAEWADRLLAMLCWPASDALLWRGTEAGLLFCGVLAREAALGCLARDENGISAGSPAAEWFAALDRTWVDLETLGLAGPDPVPADADSPGGVAEERGC